MGVYSHFYPPPPGEEPKPINWKVRHMLLLQLHLYMFVTAPHSFNLNQPPPSARPPNPNKQLCLLVLVPSVFDMVGTALAKVGLLYCTVSVYQLVRCTVIIITALLKVGRSVGPLGRLV